MAVFSRPALSVWAWDPNKLVEILKSSPHSSQRGPQWVILQRNFILLHFAYWSPWLRRQTTSQNYFYSWCCRHLTLREAEPFYNITLISTNNLQKLITRMVMVRTKNRRSELFLMGLMSLVVMKFHAGSLAWVKSCLSAVALQCKYNRLDGDYIKLLRLVWDYKDNFG